MARFDVYRYAHKTVDLVVEVQADLLSTLNTCIVIPMVTRSKAGSETLPRLKPVIHIHGSEFILVTTDLAALPRNTLGDFCGQH